jgi:hypothetical protein
MKNRCCWVHSAVIYPTHTDPENNQNPCNNYTELATVQGLMEAMEEVLLTTAHHHQDYMQAIKMKRRNIQNHMIIN